MKVRGRQVHRRPGQPVGMGGVVCALVKVGPPGLALCRVDYGRVRGKQVKWDPGAQEPEYWILDLGVHHLGQGGVPEDHGTVRYRDFNGVLPGQGLEVKQDGAPAVHLKVEVSLVRVQTRSKEELDATVLIYPILVGPGQGPDIPVLDPEHQVNGLIVIGQLDPGVREMEGTLSHMAGQFLTGDSIPWGFLP